ncbi:hypothetical protein [Geodermatophilus sp. DSM 45219]|uniref:hypothetical protein n=1 Tax=Geodermatophilus sp. DSM 45219 TaxID=1881103 RepID=UPI00088194EA|nr:hypothetical protein [Geodermatophilus sp. DSM 45219]SDO43863.1 hypothetical protein SAMN05428965_3928 [Geodermatophilus sp. DSM 45219]
MDRTTRRRTYTVVAGIALAGLVAGTGMASAQGEPAATAPAAAQHDHGTSSTAEGTSSTATEVPAQQAAPAPAPADVCAQSDLPAHTGFQAGPACVSLPFGELGAPEDNPQLLITRFPDEVAAGEPFTLQVSTRNLVRDRFLPAAEGGYYVEPATLTDDGLVRGHFHTACRVLDDPRVAPRPERQAVFVATEDGAGGATPDTVTVRIPGLSTAGEAQCATWAGDGSHRMPMMAFANQVPAFDAVRITVRGAGEETAEVQPPAPAAEVEPQAPAAEDAAEPETPATADQPRTSDADVDAEQAAPLPAQDGAEDDGTGAED